MSAEPSELARGWRLLAGCGLGVAVGVSSLYFYSLGIFIKPMALEFGWSRGVASLGALVGTAGAAAMMIPMGRLVDRRGSLPVALVSLLIFALCLAALGLFTAGLTSFLLLTALLSLATAGATPMPFSRLVVRSFERQRGLALGIVLAGTGIGGIAVPRLLTPFVDEHGWRAGFLVLGGIVAVSIPLLWLMLRNAPDIRSAATRQVTLTTLLANPAVRLLVLTFFLAATAILGSVVQFVPMLSDWGMTPRQAGSTAALIGIAAITGRLAAGYALDRLPPQVVVMILLCGGAGGLALMALGGPAMAVAGAIILGLSVGAEVDLIAFLIGRYVPHSSYGQAYGLVYTAFLVGGAVGPALSGYLRDYSGDYRLWLACASALLFLAAAVAHRLRTQRPFEEHQPAAAPA